MGCYRLSSQYLTQVSTPPTANTRGRLAAGNNKQCLSDKIRTRNFHDRHVGIHVREVCNTEA